LVTAGVYFAVSLIWIWGSDRLVARLPVSEATRGWIGSVKGTGFVAVTALCLFFHVRRELARQARMWDRLRETEVRFTQMLAVPDRVFWVLDLSGGRFEFVSGGFGPLWGESNERLLADPARWTAGMTTVEAEKLAKSREACRSGESDAYRLEYSLRRRDGSVVWIEESASVLRGNADGKRRLSGLCRDATPAREANEQLRRKEAELARSELRHRVLFEKNLLPMWICESDSLRMVLVNEAALKGYGYFREEFLGMTLPFLESEEDRGSATGAGPGKAASGRRLVRHVRKNGSIMMVDLFCQPVELDGREMQLVVAHDVTARVRAERELRRSRERLELVMAGADLGTWDWDMVTGEVVMGERLLVLLGYGVGEGGGKIDDWRGRVHPDDLRRLTRRIQSHVGGKTAVAECEQRVRSKSGRWIWVYLRGSVVERDTRGAPLRMMGTYLDITARKTAEQSLKAMTHRLQLATQAAGIGVWEWDVPTSRIVWDTLMQRLHGVADAAVPSDLNGWLGLIEADDRTGVWLAMSRLLEEGVDYRLEYRVRDPNGLVRHISSFGTIDRDRRGNPLRVVGVNYDVTDRKRAEIEVRQLNQELERRVSERTAELEATNRELEAFSYSVSHDLRAPLRAVDGFSLALGEDAGPALDETCRGHLQRIRAAARRMGQLIDDLLHLSRVTRASLKRGNVDLTALAGDVARALSSQVEDRQAELRIEPGMRASADEGLLRIVLENLVGNAFKFTVRRAAPVIEIGSRAGEGPAVFYVRDNGAGFDMNYAGKLFGAFQRLHGRDEFPGTGIGLATCQRIIHRHGGRIWAEAAVDKGATFLFTLDPGDVFTGDERHIESQTPSPS
jgi:PAS domain S-box-containing protein